MDADAAAGRQAAHVPSRLACLCLLDGPSFCAFVLPEPLQTPGRSVHAQRPRQKLQDAMSTHIRHDAAAGTIAKHQFPAATCDNSTRQTTAHAASPNRERHVRSHLVDSRSQLCTIDRHCFPKRGGQIGRAFDRAMPLPAFALGWGCVVSGGAQGTRDVRRPTSPST